MHAALAAQGVGPAQAVRAAQAVVAVLTLLAFVFGSVAHVPTAQAAVAYPGGKRIYAVTVGGLPAEGATTYPVAPFTRLAMYYFYGDGTVIEGFWAWNWSSAYPDAQTGLTSNGTGCDGCPIRTSGVFKSGNATYPKELRGTYTNDGTNVTITWSGGSQESWRVSTPEPGSNVASSTAVPIADAPLHRYVGRSRVVAVTSSGYVGDDTASGFDLTG